jgi:glycosyltransferase involved in cell wall biosynthesis
VGGWFALLSGARFVYHKQDIYPEVVTGPGILPNGRRASLLRRIDSHTDRAADRVVVLSDDMAETTKARGVWPHRIAVINNFDPWAADPDRPLGGASSNARRSSVDALNVVFAGNLGRFQNLETVIDAAALLRDEPSVHFHFFGGGALGTALAERATSEGLASAHFHGYRPPAEVAAFLRDEADIGIVSLARGVVYAAFPSKTMSYLRQGCPVLALVEPNSSLAQMVEDSGAGFQVNPTDSNALAAELLRLSAHRSDLRDAGKRAADLYVDRFSQSRQLASWSQLFESLQGQGRA